MYVLTRLSVVLVKANGTWEGGLLHRRVLSEQVDGQEVG